MKSWKTTAAGIGTLLSTVGLLLNQILDGNPDTNPDWNYVLPLLIAGFMGLFARDNDVPSEAVKKASETATKIIHDTKT